MDTNSDVRTPVLLVPGVGRSSGGWKLLRRHLERVGFSDVGGLAGAPDLADIPRRAQHLAQRVETLLELTGASRVHLVGQNVGGVVARWYTQVLGGDAHTASIVTLGTPHGGTRATRAGFGPAVAQLRPGSTVLDRLDATVRPSPVRHFNYFSAHDLFVDPPERAALTDPVIGATNVLVPEHDHLSVVVPPIVCHSVAYQLAATEGLPGHGTPITTLPGGLIRLTADDDAPSAAAIAAARAQHPSGWQADEHRLTPVGPVPVDG